MAKDNLPKPEALENAPVEDPKKSIDTDALKKWVEEEMNKLKKQGIDENTVAKAGAKLPLNTEFVLVGYSVINNSKDSDEAVAFAPLIFEVETVKRSSKHTIGAKHFSICPRNLKEALAWFKEEKELGNRWIATDVVTLQTRELPDGQKYNPSQYTVERAD